MLTCLCLNLPARVTLLVFSYQASRNVSAESLSLIIQQKVKLAFSKHYSDHFNILIINCQKISHRRELQRSACFFSSSAIGTDKNW